MAKPGKSKKKNPKRSTKKKLNLEPKHQHQHQQSSSKRPSSQLGGQGSKRRRQEWRAVQFGNPTIEPEVGNGKAHKNKIDDDLSPESSDSETTPYEKLIGLLRPDVKSEHNVMQDDEDEEQDDGDVNQSDSEKEEQEEEEDEEEGDEEEAGDGDDAEEGEDEGEVGGDDPDDRDGPEAMRELGLDATAQSSDDESAGEHSDADDEESDSFLRNFQKMTLSEEEAKALEEARSTTKWRRREVDGIHGSLLWRSGKTTTFPSAPNPDAALDSLNLDPKVLQLWHASAQPADQQEPDKEKKLKKSNKKESSATAGNDGSTRKALTDLQCTLLPILNEYLDLHFCQRTPANAAQLRELLCLHILNHITKSRKGVLRNNARLKKRQQKHKPHKPKNTTTTNNTAAAADGDPIECRDQGFTRCKVLVLLPCRNSAHAFLRTLLALCPSAHAPAGRTDGADRFEEEFGPEDDGGTAAERAADRERLLAVGEDHLERFEGNVDDHFRVGVQLHPKYARLFAPFYAADIIVASPLGLRMIVKDAGDKGREYDFLSSLELLVVDQLDYLLMQNLEHLYTVVDAANRPPQQPRGVDFSRLREVFLDDLQRHLRQTVVLSGHAAPEGNALLSRHAHNLRGAVKTDETHHRGTIRRVLDQIHARQVFHRLAPGGGGTLAEADDARFAFFTEQLYPRLSRLSQSHTLVVVPSYMQFVRLRAFLNKEEADWQECTEYSSVTQVSHARSCLFHGRCDLMVMTERFHFYHRFRLRGVHHVVFYGLPQFADFYPELVNLIGLGRERGVSVTAVYAAVDRLALQRIVGAARAERMLASDKAVHLFA